MTARRRATRPRRRSSARTPAHAPEPRTRSRARPLRTRRRRRRAAEAASTRPAAALRPGTPASGCSGWGSGSLGVGTAAGPENAAAGGWRRRRRRLALAGLLGGARRSPRDLRDRGLAETGCGEQLLGAVLGAGEDRRRLRARPLERLLDLGAGGVRELGRLVAGLLEQAVAARLRLLQLARRVGVRLGEQLAGLVAGGVQHLGALALALLAVALDLGLALLQLVLAAADLLLGPAELRRGCGLRVALDRVGELGGRADQVQRVHADGVAGRLDVRAGRVPAACSTRSCACSCSGVAAEGVEGLADAVRVEAVPALRDVLEPGQRGQRGDAAPPGPSVAIGLLASLATRRRAAAALKYDFSIGRSGLRLNRRSTSAGSRARAGPRRASASGRR